MAITKNELKLLGIIGLVFFIGYFIEASGYVPGLLKDDFEFLAELFSVFVSFSIFAMTWYAYGRSKDNHALFMGAIFLIVGALDLLHTLSYPFLPDFITHNSPEKSAIFWNMARLISAPLFLASAYVYKDTRPSFINKPVMFVCAAVLLLACLVLGLIYQDYLSILYPPTSFFSINRIFHILITGIILLYTTYLYAKRKKEKETETYLIYSFIIIFLSDLFYFQYEIAAHLLKITGFYFVYLALYKSSVELPYEKLAEAEEKLLHAVEAKYRTMIENSNDLIWMLDRQGNFTFFNKKTEEISGYRMEEWIGKSFEPLTIPADLPRIKQVFYEALAGKSVQYEVNVFRKDGTIMVLSVNTAPIYEDGEVAGAVSFGRDITELKQAEVLRLENERLTLTNQAKSEFLAIMSHELRTPMNAVIGFSELMKAKKAGDLNEKQERYIDNILTSSKHLLVLINGILDLTSVESGKIKLAIEKIPVPEAINETLNLLKATAEERNVIFKKEIDPQLDYIEADRQRFIQILFNLVGNAVKFSKEDGGIVTVTAKKEENMAKISVSDTGIGIKEEDLGKLFHAFRQLDMSISRKYGGAGLGLAISKQLVELQGGKIRAESKYGAGSTFTFLLPLKAKKHE
jgi:PAS domain S-box-containing protein